MLRVSKQQGGRADCPQAVVRHGGDRDAASPGRGGDCLFVIVTGQCDRDMQAAGDAMDAGFGEFRAQRVHQRFASPAVGGSHPAQVPVKLPAGEEAGQGMLFEVVAAQVGEAFGAGDRAEQARGEHQPADAQGGREGLAD